MALSIALIVAVFMHLAWERLALLMLIGLMWAGGLHTYVVRGLFFN